MSRPGHFLRAHDGDADDMQKLYHQTLAIRPKLIKLIEKYSQKKGMGCPDLHSSENRLDMG